MNNILVSHPSYMGVWIAIKSGRKMFSYAFPTLQLKAIIVSRRRR